MFTAFDDAQVSMHFNSRTLYRLMSSSSFISQARKQVTELGGTVTEEIDECTVLVTDKIRRTAKFLCMVAKGIPIVSPNWVKMSKEMKRFQGKFAEFQLSFFSQICSFIMFPFRI